MNYTETEALTKLCCQGMVMAGEPNGHIVKCRASECMAWRWSAEYKSHGDVFGEGGEIQTDARRQAAARMGFCGLAGTP